MPNIYHDQEVFNAYLNALGSVEEAKAAIKEAAREAAPGAGDE